MNEYKDKYKSNQALLEATKMALTSVIESASY